MKRSYKLIAVLLILIALLTLVRIGAANRISTNGEVMQDINDKISYYESENMNLRQKISVLASLSRVSSEASQLGFNKSLSGLVIDKTIPIAKR